MKRVLLLSMIIFSGFIGISKVHAVVDTGGGNVSEITTEATTEAVTEAVTSEMTLEDVTGGYIPEVNAQNFFQKVYNKLYEIDNFAQRVVAYLLIAFFVIALFLLCCSFVGDRKKIPQYAVALLIIAILFVCDIYAVQILGSFTYWASH